MSKNDDDQLDTLKVWLIWLLIILLAWLFLGRGGNSEDFEEEPDYCDVALCK